jgi:hypothetical protein
LSKRAIAWIVLGVIAAHLAAFSVVGRMKARPYAPYIPPANFGYKTTTYIDPVTGEKTIEREIRVTTKLAPAGTYEAQPKTFKPGPKQP